MKFIIWETKGPSSMDITGWQVFAVNFSGVRRDLRTFWDRPSRGKEDGLERANEWIEETMAHLDVPIESVQVIHCG